MNSIIEAIKINIEMKLCNTFLSRAKGLMFTFVPLKNKGLLLTPCNFIHMFFVFQPLDIIFLDDKNGVLLVVKELKPWRVKYVKQARAVLELPVGTIQELKIKRGVFLEFNLGGR